MLNRSKLKIASGMLILAATGFAVQSLVIATAEASNPATIGGGPVRFTGESQNGDFQEALEDALAQADIHFAGQGADIRYSYVVRGTSGQRGGFLPINLLEVTIVAQ
jgi:hypothetical protein